MFFRNPARWVGMVSRLHFDTENRKWCMRRLCCWWKTRNSSNLKAREAVLALLCWTRVYELILDSTDSSQCVACAANQISDATSGCVDCAALEVVNNNACTACGINEIVETDTTTGIRSCKVCSDETVAASTFCSLCGPQQYINTTGDDGARFCNDCPTGEKQGTVQSLICPSSTQLWLTRQRLKFSALNWN